MISLKPLPQKITLLLWLGLGLTIALWTMGFWFYSSAFASTERWSMPAKRIVSLAPNLTEMLFAIGAGQQVVGVSAYSNYPQQAQSIPVVANASHVDVEAILTLKPDLVVAWKGDHSSVQLQTLKEEGIPIYYFASQNLQQIAMAMKQLGRLTGHVQQAQGVALKFQQRLAILRQRYHRQPRVSVFYQLWNPPLMSVGKGSLINQIIDLCGGKNVLASVHNENPQVATAVVMAANPEAIIGGYRDGTWKKFWKHWPVLQAVREGHLYTIDPDVLQRPGPRIAEGASLLCYDLNRVRQSLVKSHGELKKRV